MTPTTTRELEGVLERLQNVHRNGKGWTARCPAHADQRNSLTVRDGRDGRVLVHCFANCPPSAVVAALGLELRDLFPDQNRNHPDGHRTIERAYDYCDADGRLLYQAVRFRPKDFRQRRPDGKNGWIWNVAGAPLVPYRLPELIQAGPDGVVYVVEGEKDADRLVALGLVATTNVGGAGKWRPEHSEFLRGRQVVILPDNDDPGRRHVQQVAESLAGIAMSVRILELPSLPPKGDVSDWLDMGGTIEDLQRLAAGTPQWPAQAASQAEQAPIWCPKWLLSDAERSDACRDTYVDKYVRYASRRTDAPRAFHEALALVSLSGIVGRRAVLRLTTTDVYPALWILILADSTLYRKSTAMDLAREVVTLVSRDLLTPNDFTPQRFVAILAEHDGRPLTFIRDEFSGFYDALNRLDFMAGLKETLCNIYDGRPFRREKMKLRKKEGEPENVGDWKYDIKEPFLAAAVATTEDRFAEVARANDLHSGFLPRFCFILPPKGPVARLPIREVTSEVLSARDQLVQELRRISGTEIHLTCDAAVLQRFDRYSADLDAEAQSAPNGNLVAIVGARLSWVALRIAMLLAVSDGGQRVRLPHLLRGIEIAEGWRHKAIGVLSSLAPSKFERRAVQLAQIVERAGPAGISRRNAMRVIKANKREMDDLQATLSERGEILVETRSTVGGPSSWYYPPTLSPLSPSSSFR